MFCMGIAEEPMEVQEEIPALYQFQHTPIKLFRMTKISLQNDKNTLDKNTCRISLEYISRFRFLEYIFKFQNLFSIIYFQIVFVF